MSLSLAFLLTGFVLIHTFTLMNGETLCSPGNSPQVLEQYSLNDRSLVNIAEWLCTGPGSAGDPQAQEKAAPLLSSSLSPPIQGATLEFRGLQDSTAGPGGPVPLWSHGDETRGQSICPTLVKLLLLAHADIWLQAKRRSFCFLLGVSGPPPGCLDKTEGSTS